MLEDIKFRVLQANKSLVQNGLVLLNWGNVSEIDRESGLVVIKPSGVPYDTMTIKELEERTGLHVVLWDERRTTVAAHEILHRSGKKEKKHRQSVDAVAATLILQGYLDFKRRQ